MRCYAPRAAQDLVAQGAERVGVTGRARRFPLLLYYGVLGARAAWRAEVVPRQTTSGRGEGAWQEPAAAPARAPEPTETARRQARGRCWASLMARTFGCDVLACPRCGGRLRLIALIEEAAVVGRILQHLGLPTEVPSPRPARAPPLPLGTPDQPGWDADS